MPSGDGGLGFGALAAALGLTAAVEVCDMLAVLDPAAAAMWLSFSVAAQGAMCPAWLLFTAVFARSYETGTMPLPQRIMVWVSLALPAAGMFLGLQGYYYSPDFSVEPVLFLHSRAFYFYLGVVLSAVLGLYNLEATMAGATHHKRWKIKFVLLGTVVILATQVLYYSQGLLNRSIDLSLIPARSLALLLGTGLAWYSLVRRGSEVRIEFSRRLAYKSLVLVAAGIYLVGLGLLGEGARQLGESLSPVVLMSLGIVSGLALLVIGLSETVQRKVRVFLHRNFYQEKYDYRQQWMRFTRRLNLAASREDFHQTVLLAWCETFGLEGATMFLRRRNSGRYHAVQVLEMLEPRIGFAGDSGLTARLSRTGRTLDVTRADLDLAPDEEEYLRASKATFAVPVQREGELDGFVLMGPTINKSESYDEEDFELMDTMASHVAFALLNLRLTDELAQAREMEVVGKVSTFVAHDLKNLVYTLSLVVNNAGQHIHNPEFQQDMLASLDGTIKKMKILISRLRGLPERQSLRFEPVRLLSVAREVAGQVPGERLTLAGDDVQVEADPEEMGKVILNLCLNAVEATRDGGEARLETGRDNGPYLRVMDTGCGMEEAFQREDLFRPFRSTKEGGMGIGLYQCKQIVEAHGGVIEVDSQNGRGTTITVRLSENGSMAGQRGNRDHEATLDG
jgi:putative PEP-CTERM system histidine kinase